MHMYFEVLIYEVLTYEATTTIMKSTCLHVRKLEETDGNLPVSLNGVPPKLLDFLLVGLPCCWVVQVTDVICKSALVTTCVL